VVPNGINITTFSTTESDITRIKNKYKLNQSLTIGFVGSILKWHGIDILLKGFKQVQSASKRALKLLIVGDGEHLYYYKELALELGLENVIFTGNIPKKEIPNYIKCMDIAVMTNTNWYGSPIKIFEYGALSKAMLLINSQPMLDVITPNKDAIMMAKATTEECVIGLNTLIQNAKLRTALGNHFHEKVRLKYAWKHHAQTILNTLKS